MSCINNGLVYIQFRELVDLNETSNDQDSLSYNLQITHMMGGSDIGRIFTELDFRLVDVDFNFFVCTLSPPIVFQYQINGGENVILAQSQ